MINEGKNIHEPLSNSSSSLPSESTNTRVLLLENEIVSNKIKNVEQTFSNQLNFLKLEFEKKLSDLEFKQKKCFHPRNNSSPDLKTLISKHDALNTRMRKVEVAIDEGLKKKINEYLADAKTKPDARNEISNDGKDTPIPFTPAPNETVHLPYETPFNLHKSFSEEFDSCSSPNTEIPTKKPEHFPSFCPQTQKNLEESLLAETSETEIDEPPLQETSQTQTTETSFLAKGAPNQSHF